MPLMYGFFFGFAALIAFGAPALATTFYERPFPVMVSEAPLIVRGKVGMNYTNWVEGPDRNRRIHTFTELAVDEVFKGEARGKTIVMRELGGQKDGVGMEVSGIAQFERGQDVVVLLGVANADGSHDVQGMMMGRFDVERADDGTELLSGPGLGSGTHPALRGHEESQDGPPPPKRWSIESLRKLVRDQSSERKIPPLSQVSPPAIPSVKPQTQTEEAAPRLQPVSPEGVTVSTPAQGSGWILGGVGALVLALGVFLVRRRR